MYCVYACVSMSVDKRDILNAHLQLFCAKYSTDASPGNLQDYFWTDVFFPRCCQLYFFVQHFHSIVACLPCESDGLSCSAASIPQSGILFAVVTEVFFWKKTSAKRWSLGRTIMWLL